MCAVNVGLASDERETTFCARIESTYMIQEEILSSVSCKHLGICVTYVSSGIKVKDIP